MLHWRTGRPKPSHSDLMRRRPKPAGEIPTILMKRPGEQRHPAPRTVLAAGGRGWPRIARLLTRPVHKAFIKRSQAFPVLRASALDDVVVASSGNCPKVFRFRRSVEQRPAELY